MIFPSKSTISPGSITILTVKIVIDYYEIPEISPNYIPNWWWNTQILGQAQRAQRGLQEARDLWHAQATFFHVHVMYLREIMLVGIVYWCLLSTV